MKITCEICGASTMDGKEIKNRKNNNICPICLSVGSLYIEYPIEKGDVE